MEKRDAEQLADRMALRRENAPIGEGERARGIPLRPLCSKCEKRRTLSTTGICSICTIELNRKHPSRPPQQRAVRAAEAKAQALARIDCSAELRAIDAFMRGREGR